MPEVPPYSSKTTATFFRFLINKFKTSLINIVSGTNSTVIKTDFMVDGFLNKSKEWTYPTISSSEF